MNLKIWHSGYRLVPAGSTQLNASSDHHQSISEWSFLVLKYQVAWESYAHV